MASLSLIGRLAILHARDLALAAGRSLVIVEEAPAEVMPRFTDADWKNQSDVREICDLIALSMRWSATIDVGDGVLRQYFFVGPYADCQRRARLLFANHRSITLEPAAPGLEVLDRRLSLSLARG